MEPVLHRLRRTVSDLQIIVTFSSVSAVRWPLPFADHSTFAPAEIPAHADRFLAAVRPTALVVARRDIWPVLMGRAAQRIPVALVGSAFVRRTPFVMKRLSGLYAPLLERVSWVGAVDGHDAAVCKELGVPEGCVEIVGDPAHDRALERIPNLASISALTHWATHKAVLVAGSVEPSDTKVLTDASAQILSKFPRAAVLAVPHEPDRRTVHALREAARRAGLSVSVWPGGERAWNRYVIVRRRGLLADLYALGHVAYVGGAFGRQGAHSIIEPAVYGLPVFSGEHVTSQRAASALRESGALTTVTTAQQLSEQWARYMTDEQRRMRVGLCGRGVVTPGAARRSTEVVASLLGG